MRNKNKIKKAYDKTKKMHKSKYVKNYFGTNNEIDEKTSKLRAEESIVSGTSASYVTQELCSLSPFFFAFAFVSPIISVSENSWKFFRWII